MRKKTLLSHVAIRNTVAQETIGLTAKSFGKYRKWTVELHWPNVWLQASSTLGMPILSHGEALCVIDVHHQWKDLFNKKKAQRNIYFQIFSVKIFIIALPAVPILLLYPCRQSGFSSNWKLIKTLPPWNLRMTNKNTKKTDSKTFPACQEHEPYDCSSHLKARKSKCGGKLAL